MLPVPQTPVLDNFNRANNASLGASYTVDPFHEFDVPTTSPRTCLSYKDSDVDDVESKETNGANRKEVPSWFVKL